MANANKNSGGSNLTRQHYQMATGQKVNAGGGASKPSFVKGAKVAPKTGK